MKRIVIAALLTLALGGCLHEAALDRHLYDRTENFSGPMVPPLGPQAPLLVPPGEPAPPLRDPTVTETGVPDTGVAPATSATPASPS